MEEDNRELGESPRQSRCCDFRKVPITLCHCSVWGGKAYRDGISQKTCKAIVMDSRIRGRVTICEAICIKGFHKEVGFWEAC